MKCSNFLMQRNKKRQNKTTSESSIFTYFRLKSLNELLRLTETNDTKKLNVYEILHRRGRWLAAGFQAWKLSQPIIFFRAQLAHALLHHKQKEWFQRKIFEGKSVKFLWPWGFYFVTHYLYLDSFVRWVACAFSRNRVRVPRIFKRGKVSVIVVYEEFFR